MFGWAMGMSPIMLRLCVPMDVSCTPSFSGLSVDITRWSWRARRA